MHVIHMFVSYVDMFLHRPSLGRDVWPYRLNAHDQSMYSHVPSSFIFSHLDSFGFIGLGCTASDNNFFYPIDICLECPDQLDDQERGKG